MKVSFRAVLELVFSVLAIAGAAACWAHSSHTVLVAPVLDGQPATLSVNYDPWQLALTFLLATVAGVLMVVGGARMWRTRKRLALLATPTS